MYNTLYEQENTELKYIQGKPIIATIKQSRHSNVSIQVVDTLSNESKVKSVTPAVPEVMPLCKHGGVETERHKPMKETYEPQ